MTITHEEDQALREAIAAKGDPFALDVAIKNETDAPVTHTIHQMGYAPTVRATKPDVGPEDYRDCFVVVHAALEPLSETQRQRVLRATWELFGLKGAKL